MNVFKLHDGKWGASFGGVKLPKAFRDKAAAMKAVMDLKRPPKKAKKVKKASA